MIGLGRMGGNMAQRLLSGGHRIVAYDPRAEAVEAARILEARVSVATHFGTFKLADDGMREPVEDLKKALCALGDDAPAFWVLEEGSARVVPGREAAAGVDARTRD